MVWETEPADGVGNKVGTPGNFQDWRAANRTIDVLSGVAAWLAAAGLLAACADGTSPANEQRVAMAPISFNEIAGWADDKHAEALVSFRRSCPKLTAGPDTKIATDGGFKTITPAEWKKICDSAAAVKAGMMNPPPSS